MTNNLKSVKDPKNVRIRVRRPQKGWQLMCRNRLCSYNKIRIPKIM